MADDMMVAGFAAIFRIERGGEKTFYVMGCRSSDGVLGFSSLAVGLDHFESAYAEAHRKGLEFSNAAILNFITLAPRVFRFSSLEEMSILLGGPRIFPVKIAGDGVNVVGYKCVDLVFAEEVYARATEPKLCTPSGVLA